MTLRRAARRRARHNRVMSSAPVYTVVCLCAEWCGTCRDYRRAFAAHAERAAGVRHLWVDIEDDAGWLGDVDLETLPTLLVLRDASPVFYGPVLPHADVIERTLRAVRDCGATTATVPPEFAPALAQLLDRVREAAP
jgi:thioredoxin-like negative regulator of GroEL